MVASALGSAEGFRSLSFPIYSSYSRRVGSSEIGLPGIEEGGCEKGFYILGIGGFVFWLASSHLLEVGEPLL